MIKLELPSVTLCAATSTNVDATLSAISASSDKILFGDVVIFTDSPQLRGISGGRVERIAPLRSGRDYSTFVLRDLADHIHTEHCLIVQWDGFVFDATRWNPRFLEFDYVGAPWPQFRDGKNVGNGGFSLRSRKLLEACRSSGFIPSHPEDVAIGRVNRSFLEEKHGVAFADDETAAQFSLERSITSHPTFGFHGVFNMIPLLGPDRFWDTYLSLDDRTAVFHDFSLVIGQLGASKKSTHRRTQITLDLLRSCFARARVRQT